MTRPELSPEQRSEHLVKHLLILDAMSTKLKAAEEKETRANRAMMIANTERRAIQAEFESQVRIVRRIQGLASERQPKTVLGWGEIQCPKCSHAFIPSRLAARPDDL